MNGEAPAVAPLRRRRAAAPVRSRAEAIRSLMKDFALPLAIVAVPLLYQWMAGQQAAENHRIEAEKAAENHRIEAEKAAVSNKARLDREQKEQKFQLYTSLLSKREEADSSVRRGLFDKLIGTYLQPNTKDLSKRMVALELLALNFHDSLNLNPLFWEQHRQVELKPEGPQRRELQEQLERVAKQVKDRQAARLEVDGFRSVIEVNLNFLFDGASPVSTTFIAAQIDESGLQSAHSTREFTLSVLTHDAQGRRLWVVVSTPGLEKQIGFWVDPYDFPLVNFTRISRSERFAVILDTYDQANAIAKLVFLYFPSSRSAAKDTPYIDDLLATLVRPAAELNMSPVAGPASGAEPRK